MSIKVFFQGGLELLFNNETELSLEIPSESSSFNISDLIQLLSTKVTKQRELFLDNSDKSTVRPGILVLVNDTDWDLVGLEEYKIEDGDEIAVNAELSTDDIMKTIQVNNKNLVEITSDFKVLSKNLVEGKGTVGALLTDDEIAKNFKSIVVNLQKSTAEANKMIADLNQFSEKLNTKGGLADKMLTDTVVFNRLQASITELQKTAKSAAILTENLND